MNETVEQAPQRFEACIFFDGKLLEQRRGNDAQELEVWMLSAAGDSGNFSGNIVDRQNNGKLVKAFRRTAPD
ncbi:hypothetical protein [Microbulbifer hainanensis]|uniref:hypothetical protein n=1 Tax=Microbulbifer hainanensis TaxID=2735675 RepID=UPI0018690638|nr:hypothetical protein [Microbulbifer hainanensis]